MVYFHSMKPILWILNAYDGELAPGVARNGVFDMIIPFSDLLRLK